MRAARARCVRFSEEYWLADDELRRLGQLRDDVVRTGRVRPEVHSLIAEEILVRRGAGTDTATQPALAPVGTATDLFGAAVEPGGHPGRVPLAKSPAPALVPARH